MIEIFETGVDRAIEVDQRVFDRWQQTWERSKNVSISWVPHLLHRAAASFMLRNSIQYSINHVAHSCSVYVRGILHKKSVSIPQELLYVAPVGIVGEGKSSLI